MSWTASFSRERVGCITFCPNICTCRSALRGRHCGPVGPRRGTDLGLVNLGTRIQPGGDTGDHDGHAAVVLLA